MIDPDFPHTLIDGVLTIRLPGTDSWKDMVANLRVGRRRVYGCRVNKIDRREALFVIRKLRTQIAQAHTIRLYGHSRGGAIALQIGFELAASNAKYLSIEALLREIDSRDYISIFVTAAKTTGDKHFCYLIEPFVDGAYRQRGDVIPYLPPWQANVRHTAFGKRQPFWVAHRVRNYREWTI